MTNLKVESIAIQVSSRILRHISRGIYRSPAGALKELVSNSYDAGAKKVTINTGYPVIEKITVTDNGKGMSKQKFIDIIQRIGFSEKNLGEEVDVIKSKNNTKRKTIGHYGIGFLAIGQLAKKAIITSKTLGSNSGIRATMDFDQFEVHTVDGKQRSRILEESKVEEKDKRKKRNDDEQFHIGQCLLEEVNFDKNFDNESFTRVELIDIREDVQKQIVGSNISQLNAIAEDQKGYSSSFEEILKLLREKEKQRSEIRINNQTVPRIREYFYEMLLWELAAYSPLAYPIYPMFTTGALKHFGDLANKSEFELIVDGFILKKPYESWFWEEDSTRFSYKIYKWENEKYYNENTVSAYIIYQPGTMIRPKALQGVIVRENLVAVGLYDSTFLNYPFNEGTKFNSLTGEIFATGLAGAMNVDRDSFNQTAEEYVALTEWFHNKLYKEVFPEIKSYQQTKESPSRVKNSNLVSEVLNIIAKRSKKIHAIEFQALGKSEGKRLKIHQQKLIINTDHKDCDMSVAKREKLMFAVALIVDGFITDDIFEKVADDIERTKNFIKKNA